jgi:hypothetical protein
VSRVVPRRLPADATQADRLRYVRHWAIVGALFAVPFWVLVFLPSGAARLLFVVVISVSLLNVASLSWRIRRVERR